MSKEHEHIEKIRREKFWLDENGQLRDKNPLIEDLRNSIERLSEGLYSKDTHFIFELVQNAEDNTYKETEPSLSFQLLKADPTGTTNATGALIIQNNETGFSLDNVDAICAVGKTTKNKIKGYIGEKGIGFKSVFRITTIPHIFSNGYQFCFPEKDEETSLGYIVPHWVKNIPAQIDPRQTTIILPLDKPDFGYERIEEMLRDIEPETILFLSKLKKIQIGTNTGDDLTILKDDTKNPRIQLFIEGKRQGKSFSNINEFLLYTKTVDKPEDVSHEKRIGIDRQDISIAFPLDENKESAGKIFAYLPVRSDTGLPFLINADFILPSSREDIQDVPWNRWLMSCVANSVVEALPLLKKKKFLTVALLESLAKKMNELDKDSLFYPIVEVVSDALMDHELLPADEGTFVSARNAKLARRAELRKLLTHDQLRELFQSKDNIRWLSGEITQDLTPDLCIYLMSKLDVEEIRPERFAKLITDEFLETQTDYWIIQFYNFLKDKPELWKKPNSILRQKRILRLEDKSHVIPFQQDGHPNAFLPSSSKTNFPTIKRAIFNDKGAEEFLRNLRLIEPGLFAEVIEVFQKYTENSISIDLQKNIEDLRKINKLLKTPSQNDRKNSIGKLRILLTKLKLEEFEEFLEKKEPTKFIPILLSIALPPIRILRAVNHNRREYKSAKEIYLNTDELHMYFENNPNAWFVDKSYPEDLEPLFKELSIACLPRVKRKDKDNKGYVIIRDSRSRHERGLHGFDPDIKVDGLEYVLKHPTIEKSKFIWSQIAIDNADCIHGIVESSSRKTYEDSKKEKQVSEKFGQLLIDTLWLPDKQGNFHKPGELKLDDLPELFIRDENLADQLGMKKDVVAKLAEEAGISQATLDIAKGLESHPELLAEVRKKLQPVEPAKKSPEKIDYKNELKSSFNRLGKTEPQDQNTDEGKVKNPRRRAEKIQENIEKNKTNEPSSEERFKKIPRKVWEGKNCEARTFLAEQYGGKCQICNQTFKKRNGQPYFEGLYLVSRTNARWIDRAGNILCLCANHSAKLQHASVEAGSIIEQIKSFKIEKDEERNPPALRIKLCGEECKITYTEKHLLDLQELIRASESQE